MTSYPLTFFKGRGTASNRASRFEAFTREAVQEPQDAGAAGPQAGGTCAADTDAADTSRHRPRPKTVVVQQLARSIISRNRSPDLPFDQSINPYQGCEHGCVYCYARPTHAYLGLSSGLDFETRIFAKTNAAALLRNELSKPGYRPGLMVVGANTDPYQPAERKLGITRSLLEVLAESRLPVGIITKNALITRDLDLLLPMAQRGLLQVNMSITTLDPALARILDPRASAPAARLAAIGTLAQAGVAVAVFSSPMIPVINDTELESILQAAANAGARYASYVGLRLPLEVRDLFVEWLQAHFPLRATHVMHRLQAMHAGKDYNASFATRMKGSGPFADLLAQRFARALKRYGLQKPPSSWDTTQFLPPDADPAQGRLF